MSTTTTSAPKSLLFRGEPSALLPLNEGKQLAFTSRHPERQATALYRLDLDSLKLEETALPDTDGSALALVDGNIWLAASNGQLYQASNDKNLKLSPLAEPFVVAAEEGKTAPAVTVALIALSEQRVALLQPEQLLILDLQAQVLQTLALPAAATALAVDDSGTWLAVGDKEGHVAVYESEDKAKFQLSERAKLHAGVVSALSFTGEELRFLSAGQDKQILLTHARGELQPEDRSRNNGHDSRCHALLWGDAERFYSGSADGTIKAWQKQGNAKPFTVKDGVGKVRHMAAVNRRGRHYLLLACSDDSLRLLLLDASGKPDNKVELRLNDAYTWAEQQFDDGDIKAREQAQDLLATYNDSKAITLLSANISNDKDAKLRLRACEKLCASNNPKSAKSLEQTLSHNDEAVRSKALEGLRSLLGEADLRPLQKALSGKHADVGQLAIAGVQALAGSNPQAKQLLIDNLDAKLYPVREAALHALEVLASDDSPEADLQALRSQHDDLRRYALIRLYQRDFVGHMDTRLSLPRVASMDSSATVRRTAWLIAVLSRPELAKALRRLDKDLHRQLFELETWNSDTKQELPRVAKAKVKLDNDDLAIPLQAMASPALDTCLAGARALAQLNDPRAFGLLLQLSREAAPESRVAVCRALAELGDARAIGRLCSLLDDSATEVRDAAFSALVELHKATPLQAVSAGLNAEHEDVRRRAFQLLSRDLKQQAKDGAKATADFSADSIALLQRSLNDPFKAVHQDAFKAALNQELGGDAAATLRFLLNSNQETLRKEVLTEVMAQYQSTWAWPLLLELLDDPAATIRRQSFEFGSSKFRSQHADLWKAALASQYSDMRELAIDAAIKRRGAAGQTVLLAAIDDVDHKLRLKAVKVLISRQNQDALQQVLASQFDDIRLAAAVSLAGLGDRSTLAAFEQQLSSPMPEGQAATAEAKKNWQQLLLLALSGVAEIGDFSDGKSATLLEQIITLSKHQDSTVRSAAVATLVFFGEAAQAALQAAQRDADNGVRSQAAYGLALAGDHTQLALLLSDAKAQKSLDHNQLLVAALNAGAEGEAWFARQLDSQLASQKTNGGTQQRDNILLVMLLRELKQPGAEPERAIAALASAYPEVRLAAGLLLEHFSSPDALLTAITQLANERGLEGQQQKPWAIDEAVFAQLGDIFCAGPLLLQQRAVALLDMLSGSHIDAFEQHWQALQSRFAETLTTVSKAAAKHKRPKASFKPEQLQDLAFGSYVGLLRPTAAAGNSSSNSGRRRGKKTTNNGPENVRASLRQRQAALRQLQRLAEVNTALVDQAWPVLIRCLNDSNGEIRLQAYQALEQFADKNADRAVELSANTLHTGHADIGLQALRLSIDSKEGVAQAEAAMLQRTDGLQDAAAELLEEKQGKLWLASRAIHATAENLREDAILSLGKLYTDKKDGKKAVAAVLEGADSDWPNVRRHATNVLARHAHPKAFDYLERWLQEAANSNAQGRIMQAMRELDGPRAAAACVARLQNDPNGNAGSSMLSQLRFEDISGKPQTQLLELVAHKNHGGHIGMGLWKHSGFSQHNPDPDEELLPGTTGADWEAKQEPRRAELATALLRRVVALEQLNFVKRWLPALYWSRDAVVEPLFAELAEHPDEQVRAIALSAISWRFEKRNGPAEPLEKALKAKHPQDQFLAAEGLARLGRNDGLSILLTAVDYWDQLEYRERAVRAIGLTQDQRGFDKLLGLASDEEHALQADAAIALGRLGEKLAQSSSGSEDFDAIFKLLKTAVNEDYAGEQYLAAINGLRFLNHPLAWTLIQERMTHDDYDVRMAAVTELGYHDDDTSRELILKCLREDDDDEVHELALTAARRSFGTESLLPDYAALENDFHYDEVVERIAEAADPEQILSRFGRIADEELQEQLATIVMQADPLPSKAALAALDTNNAAQLGLAASILGRLSKVPKATASGIEKQLQRHLGALQEVAEQQGHDAFNWGESQAYRQATNQLLWTAARHSIAESSCVELLQTWQHSTWDSCRIAALQGVVARGAKPTSDEIAATQNLCAALAPKLRQLAAAALADWDSKAAQSLLSEAMSSRGQIMRLAKGDYASLAAAAGQHHYQGTVLPLLLQSNDVKTLLACANDAKAEESARLGAIEALAQLADAKVEAALADIGKDEAQTDSFRQAAWKARRRSIRRRQSAY